MRSGWLHRPQSSSRRVLRKMRIKRAYWVWVTRESGAANISSEMPARRSKNDMSSPRWRAPSKICWTCKMETVCCVTGDVMRSVYRLAQACGKATQRDSPATVISCN